TSAQRGMLASVRSSGAVFMAKNNVSITLAVLLPSFSVMVCSVLVKILSPLKMPVSSAKKQKISRAIKWFISWLFASVPHSGLFWQDVSSLIHKVSDISLAFCCKVFAIGSLSDYGFRATRGRALAQFWQLLPAFS